MPQDHSFPRSPEPHDLTDLAAEAHQALLDKQARGAALRLPRRAARWLQVVGWSAVLSASAFLAWYAQSQASAPSPQQLDRGRAAILSLISASLADHLRAFGGYPERLEEALPLSSDMEVSYRRTGTGYELEIRGQGGHVLTVRHG